MSWAAETLSLLAPGGTTFRRPVRGYGRGLAADVGGYSAFWDGMGDARDTGLVVLAGEAWAARGPASGPDLLARTLGAIDHLARLDLCADYTGAVPGIDEMFDRWETRTSRLRGCEEIRQKPSGYRTLYIGSRASDRLLRVYNMRGPLRLELQYRNEPAGELADDVLRVGSDEAHRAHVARLVDWPAWPAWRALVPLGPLSSAVGR